MKLNENMKSHGERGNAIAIILVALLVVAGIAMIAMSGKVGNFGKSGDMAHADEHDENDHIIVAVVNGDEIKKSDVINIIEQMPPQMQQLGADQLVNMAYEQAIGNTIIDQKTKYLKLEKDPEIAKKVKELKSQLVRTKYIENMIDAKITDEVVQDEYNQYLDNFEAVKEAKAAHILVEEKADAEAILKELNDGGDFAMLAKENSIDGSAEKGGELVFFTKEEVVPAFADVVFAMNVGDVTKAPVKSQFGYHIIRLDEMRDRPPMSLEDITPYIKQDLKRVVLSEVVAELKEGADIVKFDLDGNPLPQPELATEDAAPAQEAAPAADVDAEKSE